MSNPTTPGDQFEVHTAVDMGQVLQVVHHRDQQNRTDHKKLRHGFAQIDERIHAKHARQTRHRVELAKVGQNHLGRKDKTTR